ncbi:DNA-binding transcriptional regulator GbsR, MarR family [Bizionia echini]|uniref:DNA-binding transcriptional regulator GbsR, MarR family n=2 Tax=Bizionia echini TaxID=649333 RepID=A0A1I4ZGE8_9FLAO|nr:transcriptional regulator [Bizionia echini]SFN49344.1 DNA-binding transcriptional regulator GbsR, MarR family [Bizionia echini]
MIKTLKEKKHELVEKLGVHFENSEQLAPVAARILAYIILTGKAGVTFDDLVSDLCASKSTISSHLNHLQDIHKISYFTKMGDRKKYFVINSDSLIQSIDAMIGQWEMEKELHIEITDYKREINTLKSTSSELKFDLTYHHNYIKFLNLAMASMSELKFQVASMKTQTSS